MPVGGPKGDPMSKAFMKGKGLAVLCRIPWSWKAKENKKSGIFQSLMVSLTQIICEIIVVPEHPMRLITLLY